MLSRRMETVKTLLRVRERLEDLRAMELAASLRARDDARAQRDRVAESLRDNLMERARAQRNRFQPAIMRHRAQYERYLAQLLDAADATLRQREQEVEERRAVLIEAARDRKVMEKLKEKVNQAYQAGLLRLERRELDDLTSARSHSGSFFQERFDRGVNHEIRVDRDRGVGIIRGIAGGGDGPDGTSQRGKPGPVERG